MSCSYELTKLVNLSPKRDVKLHSIQVKNNSSGSNEEGKFVDGLKNPTIKLFCHIRQTVCADCLNGVIRNFDELQKLWDWSLQNCSCSEMEACICGIKVYTLKFSYCFRIHLAHLILYHTDNLSQTLQGTQMTAVNAQVVSRACVTTFESIRSESEFNLCWNNVKQFAENHKMGQPHLRRKNIPNRYMIGKAVHEHPEKVEEGYRRQYYAVLDSVISCIKERFEQKDYKMYATLQQLLNKAILGESFEEELRKVIGFYHDDFNDNILTLQLRTLLAKIGQGEGSVNTFHDIEILVKQLKKPIRNLISEVV